MTGDGSGGDDGLVDGNCDCGCGVQSNQVFQRERYKDIVRRKEDLLAANAVGLGSAGCV